MTNSHGQSGQQGLKPNATDLTLDVTTGFETVNIAEEIDNDPRSWLWPDRNRKPLTKDGVELSSIGNLLAWTQN